MGTSSGRGRDAWYAARAALAGLVLIASAAAGSAMASGAAAPEHARSALAVRASADVGLHAIAAGTERTSGGSAPERSRPSQADAADVAHVLQLAPGSRFASLSGDVTSVRPGIASRETARAPPAEGSA